MIRLRRTYGDLMVNVAATREKLRVRARRAVALATDLPEAEIGAARDAAGAGANVAIVSLLTGLPAGEGRRRLEAAGGAVRRAVEGA